MADYQPHQRSAFAARFGLAWKDSGLTRQRIVDLVGLGPNSASQVSQWANGDISPPRPPVVFELERILNLDAGDLSKHLGYLPVIASEVRCTFEDAIASDQLLTDDERDSLLSTYRVFTSRGA